MDFKQLRSFVAVVDCGSFTKAAARLYTSQPTVSAHIRQLEDELHQRLTALVLDRSDSIHLQRAIQRRPLRLRQLLPHMLVEALQKTAAQLR